jgi:hypothetical protein
MPGGSASITGIQEQRNHCAGGKTVREVCLRSFYRDRLVRALAATLSETQSGGRSFEPSLRGFWPAKTLCQRVHSVAFLNGVQGGDGSIEIKLGSTGNLRRSEPALTQSLGMPPSKRKSKGFLHLRFPNSTGFPSLSKNSVTNSVTGLRAIVKPSGAATQPFPLLTRRIAGRSNSLTERGPRRGSRR